MQLHILPHFREVYVGESSGYILFHGYKDVGYSQVSALPLRLNALGLQCSFRQPPAGAILLWISVRRSRKNGYIFYCLPSCACSGSESTRCWPSDRKGCTCPFQSFGFSHRLLVSGNHRLLVSWKDVELSGSQRLFREGMSPTYPACPSMN